MKCVKLLILTLALFSLYFLRCFGGIFCPDDNSKPPPHIPKPKLDIRYVGPKNSPDGETAYFIKVVSQYSTKLYYHATMHGAGWIEGSYIEWSKYFLCHSARNGEDPLIVAELPEEKFKWDDNTKFTGPVAFTVSWSKKKALAVVMRDHDNFVLIDLDSGKCQSSTVGDPNASGINAIPYGHLEFVSVEPIEQESAILWCIGDGAIGTLDFHGNVKTMDQPEYARIIAQRKELVKISSFLAQQKKLSEYAKTGRSFSWPVWNEEQKVFAIAVRPKYTPSGMPNEIWVYNSNFEIVEKFSFDQLLPVIQAKRKKMPIPEHKYAWTIDKLLNDCRMGFLLPSPNPNEPASYYNPNVGPPPGPKNFHLENHIVDQKRISTNDARSMW